MINPRVRLSTDGGSAGGAGSPLSGAGAPSGAQPNGAAPSGSSPAPSAAPNPSGASDWTSGFNDDLKGYVGNKGFKGVQDIVESYRNLEKLRGVPQERLLTLPERFYDDSGKLTAEGRALRERIGAPKEAKDYTLATPKDGVDPKLMEHFRGVFHELGTPKDDAEKLTGAWNSFMESQANSAKEQALQRAKDSQAQLQKEWGAAMDQNINIAKEAIRVMGMKTEQVTALESALGHAEAAKLFHKLGTQVREAPFIGGQRPDAVLEPVNAKAAIKGLIADRDFGKRLESGDKDAVAKWQRLHQQAYPGDTYA